MQKNKWLFTVIFTAFLLLGVLSIAPVLAQAADVGVSRLSGNDRYGTSIAISKAGWTQSNSVIIATGLDYPDALSASAMAKSYDAPILLTQKNELNPDTVAEINRLKPAQAILVGGTGVIGDGVKNQLENMGVNVIRVGGINRYETSKLVAEKLTASNGIIVATGSNFPDALSIAPIAGIKSMPILLSPKASLDSYVSSFIQGENIPASYIIGGTGVLSSNVASSVPNSTRLGGGDRYQTNEIINNQFSKALNFNTVYLAAGSNFPDALSGSALAAKNNSPIILTETSSISSETIAFLESKGVKNIVIIGGTGAVSQYVQNAISKISYAINVTLVSLSKMTDTLTVGDTDTLTAAVAPVDATNKSVVWSSSNTNAVTVDSNGNIKAVGAGEAVITVKTIDQGKTSSCSVTVSHMPAAYSSILSSNNPDNYIKVDVLSSGGFNVSGKLLSGHQSIAVCLENVNIDPPGCIDGFTKYITTDGTGNFSLTYNTNPADGEYDLCFFLLDSNGNGTYINGIGLIKDSGCFKYSPVYEYNVIKFKDSKVLSGDTIVNVDSSSDIETLKNLALQITSNITSNYDKVLAIHDWVSTNIYYDYDALNSGYISQAEVDPMNTLTNRRSVCQGYAELTTALVRSIGIPCKTVIGYGLGLGDATDWNAVAAGESNHAWNEAYVNGRWLIIDTTWDSGNSYQNGQYIKGDMNYRYFDPTLEAFSIDHRIEDVSYEDD